ncbi:MAG TPA: hypothetical protein VH761_17635 [Ilumatobacteraceae bacterium]|jgi:hypothetical protein
MNIEVSPSPSDEEVAAILAATEVLWPRQAMIVPAPPLRRPTWRFSNRWWVKPVPTRRERPNR